jgi:predicted DNA-binding antitoxin AbrB/MazE fold protein
VFSNLNFISFEPNLGYYDAVMDQTTTAIYENGILRPAAALDLPEHSEVEITIHTNGDSLDDKVGRALEAAGLSIPRQIRKSPISDERRAELARMYSSERPLGDYIREDRDAR